MDIKDDLGFDPIDLSAISHRRKKLPVGLDYDALELDGIALAHESKGIVDKVFTSLTASSPLKNAVYVPDRVYSLIDCYGELNSSKFYGLVSLVLDTAMDSIYDEAYFNVFADLVNDYLDKHELLLANRVKSKVVMGSRSYLHMENVKSCFNKFPLFLYDNARAYLDRHHRSWHELDSLRDVGVRFTSALGLSEELELKDKEILDLQNQVKEIKEELVYTSKAYDEDISGRDDTISSLSKTVESLNSTLDKEKEASALEIRRLNDKINWFAYYNFFVPRPFRHIKRLLLGLAHRKRSKNEGA